MQSFVSCYYEQSYLKERSINFGLYGGIMNRKYLQIKTCVSAVIDANILTARGDVHQLLHDARLGVDQHKLLGLRGSDV